MQIPNVVSSAPEELEAQTEPNSSEKRTIEFTISGGGGEFQFHRLDESEAETLGNGFGRRSLSHRLELE